jgi:hypothetical protein
MKAFVKTNNGTFPNVNFYLAWEAFNTMGYNATCFEEHEIDNLDITKETPVFAYFKDRGGNFFSGALYAITFIFSLLFTAIAWIAWLISFFLSK